MTSKLGEGKLSILPEMNESLGIETMIASARGGRVALLPENISQHTKRHIFDELKRREDGVTLEVNIDQFLRIVTEEDVKWFLSQEKYSLVCKSISKVSVEKRIAVLESLLHAGQYRFIADLLESREIGEGTVASSFAQALLENGEINSVTRNIHKFQEGSLSQEIALLLIEMGPNFGSAVNFHPRQFGNFSQRVFDAFYQRNALYPIVNQLAKYRGLSVQSRRILLDAGFQKEVAENEGAFEKVS